MALILANAASVKPEIALAQALKDYETILSDEEKNHFHTQAVPNATAAINLTTLIDRECNSRRRQCIGPRLITFLESIQQFSAILDTFVSSHPEMAALLWGGVKVALLTANNVSSYFNKLSTLLMSVGRDCPRFSEFGLLFSSSTRLQRALCEYYAAIVRLCKYSMQSFRKPVYSRLSTALFKSFEIEFGPYERDILRLSHDVRDEITLASKQAQKLETELQAEERQKAGMSRSILVKFRDKAHRDDEEAKIWRLKYDRRNLERKRLKVLNAFSTYDHQKTYRQIRKECVPGTCNWIYKNSEFKTWLTGTPRSLWCTGKLGSGKSVISACVTSHIIETVYPQNVTSFFFCRYDDHESLKAKTIIGSIARQLAATLPADSFHGFNFDSIDATAAISFLKSALHRASKYYIVLDGLDECEEVQVKEITEILHELLDCPGLQIKIFWSSRPNVVNWLSLKFRPQSRIILETEENQNKITLDIQKLIENTLEEWLDGEAPQMQINDPALILTIVNHLQEEAQGMFLWVKFQLQTLCEKQTDKQIIAALKNLPRDLPQTFERILQKFTEADDIDIGKRIFHWVAVAKRPLTAEELQEAIGIEPLQEMWDDKSLINNMKKAIACCGNLVFLDEEQQTIHFTHSSVKQYLSSNAINEHLGHYCVNLEKVDAEIGAICVTYLNFAIFNTQVARSTAISTNIGELPSAIVKNSLSTRTSGNKIALRILRRHNKSSRPVHCLLEEIFNDTEVPRKQNVSKQYPFRSYANRFWLEHTRQRIDPNSRLWRLWCNLAEGADWRNTLSDILWTSKDCQMHTPDLMRWIVEHNHCSLTQFIMCSKTTLSFEETFSLMKNTAMKGQTELITIMLGSEAMSQDILDKVLPFAAGSGHLTVVEKLIRAKASVDVPDYERDMNALQAAARGGHLAIVELLIKEGAEVNALSFNGGTALYLAVENGHRAVAEQLLQYGADVNLGFGDYSDFPLGAAAKAGNLSMIELLIQRGPDINARSYGDVTALYLATRDWNLTAVDLLLQKGADVNARSFDEKTALHVAARYGHLKITELLLQKGADVNARSSIGETALHVAAKSGHLAITELLLQKGADVNARLFNEQTAFHAAAASGHLKITELLLQKGADVIARSYGEGAALHAAAQYGHLEITELLLQKGADVNAHSFIGKTALHAAAKSGHLAITELLLQKGADVNARSFNKQTALHAAAESGHLEITELLLQKGADVNARSFNKQTALHAAAKSGHLEITELLLQKGADVNARLPDGKTALHIAAQNGHLKITELLLQKGADVNARSFYDETALHIAAQYEHLKITELLLQKRADVNAHSSIEETALHAAAKSGHLAITELLLQKGADVNARSSYEKTALHTAAECKHLAITELLLQKGADVNARSNAGNTPLSSTVARRAVHQDVVQRLRDPKRATK